jgi:hypothetical protein
VFKKALKQRSSFIFAALLMFGCVFFSLFFAIIQATTVEAATQAAFATPTPDPTPSPTAGVTPTPTPAKEVTLVLSSTTISAGQQLMVSGENWLPPQSLTIQIAESGQQTSVLVSKMTISDSNGNFSTTVSIPAKATTGTYTLVVFCTNNPSTGLRAVQDLMIYATTPTATVTPSATPSPSPSASASPTATGTTNSDNTNGGNGPGLTILIFVLGGLGILLLITGIIMFAASPPTPSTR